jgi:hypothetical protein
MPRYRVSFAVKATAGAQNTQFLPGTECGVSFLRCVDVGLWDGRHDSGAGRTEKFKADEGERLKRIRF